MKILVTGGTGFVGKEIVRQLHEAKHSIRILAREPSSKPAQQTRLQFGADLYPGDILKASSLPRALDGVDAVMHLVGIISEVNEATFENVHTRGTENLLAATKQAAVQRWVHMSALGVRSNAVARYHKSKWAAEEAVRQSGLDFTIFRPSLIYGARDHFINLFARMVRFSPVIPVIGSRYAQFQPVAVEMVAQAFVASLSEAKSVGQTYDLCGRDKLTMAQIIREIVQVMRRQRLIVHVPSPLARFQAAVLEFVFRTLLRRASPLNRDQLIMLEEDNTGNAQPAIDLFGLKGPSFRDGIASYLRPGAQIVASA
jgi:uncharacterized protein YbjT (DUF2867 family)